jgi:hypothetical protein
MARAFQFDVDRREKRSVVAGLIESWRRHRQRKRSYHITEVVAPLHA